MSVKVELNEQEVAIVEYAVQQYINKVQERLAEEYSGVARLMLESNIIYAKDLLAKVAPEPVSVDASNTLPEVEG